MSAAKGSSRRPRFLLALVLLLCPLAAQGQAVRVSALAIDTNPLKESNEIRLVRMGSFDQEPFVRVGQELADGDLLESVTGKLLLEVTCPQGSLVRFWGQFRVVIQPSEVQCAFNMLTGNSDFLAVEPTEVGLGGPVAGSRSTQYGIRLSRKGDDLIRRVLVFEGEVFTSDRKDVINAGQQLVYEGGKRYQPEKIAVQDLKRTAEVYARFDVSKAIYAGAVVPEPEWLVGELSSLHYDVLERPGDPEKRIQLGSKQREYKIDAEANFNLQRVPPNDIKPLEPVRDSKHYCVEAIKQYQTGDKAGAARYARKAFELNRTDNRLSAVSEKDYDTCKQLSTWREKETNPSEPAPRDSRYYCAEASKAAGRKDMKTAAELARRGLKRYDEDHRLTQAEYDACRRLIGPD